MNDTQNTKFDHVDATIRLFDPQADVRKMFKAAPADPSDLSRSLGSAAIAGPIFAATVAIRASVQDAWRRWALGM